MFTSAFLHSIRNGHADGNRHVQPKRIPLNGRLLQPKDIGAWHCNSFSSLR